MCGVCTPDKSFKMSKRLIRPIERQRMRPWLECLLNRGSVDGLKWIDGEEKIFEIPWRHGSRHGWNPTKDADLFERWAKHTGRFDVEKPNPKKWKANFRCALNSLADVKEITPSKSNKENKCVKIYQFVEDPTSKFKIIDGRRPYKRRKISSEADSSSKYSTDIATSPASFGSSTVKPSPIKRSKSSTNDVTSTQNMTESIFVVLPDSTSKTYDEDDTAKECIIKKEAVVPIELAEIEIPFKPDIVDCFDIEIERGVLYNHMSGFVLISNCDSTELSRKQSNSSSPSYNSSCNSEIVASSTNSQGSEAILDDDSVTSGSSDISTESSAL